MFLIMFWEFGDVFWKVLCGTGELSAISLSCPVSAESSAEPMMISDGIGVSVTFSHVQITPMLCQSEAQMTVELVA